MNRIVRQKGEYEMTHNPGHDFRRIVYWMNQEKPHIAPYLMPTITLLCACFSFEGYVSMVGQYIDPEWTKFNGTRPTLKARLKRIYLKINKPFNCDRGIWLDILGLFKMRVKLVHSEYKNQKEVRTDEIPDIFEILEEKYSLKKIKDILEEAIDTVLRDANLPEDLKDEAKTEGYEGPSQQVWKDDVDEY
jgi:hypothetical protein